MADLTLNDEEPTFHAARHEDGDVQLLIRADGTCVRVRIGRTYEDACTLAENLARLAQQITTEIVEAWEDIPDEFDGYVTFDRGRYHVSLEGANVGGYPCREVAEIELARAMVTRGAYLNCWYINDRGITDAIDDTIRSWHDQGGDAIKPLTGVQYQPGDRVWDAAMDWPYVVTGDWGLAGVEIHTEGDPSVRVHITDRRELRRVED
jgi:hypothetical protein